MSIMIKNVYMQIANKETNAYAMANGTKSFQFF